jgi:polyferredoxin
MDACDEVMEKIDRPTGLIRYDSESGIEKGERKIFTTRVLAYTGILAALLIFQSFLFMTRTDVETILLRTPGMLYQETEDGQISNLYNYQLINKTNEDITNVELKLVDIEGEISIIGAIQDVPAQKVGEGAMFIKIDPDVLQDRKTTVRVKVYSNGELIDEAKTNFLGPVK